MALNMAAYAAQYANEIANSGLTAAEYFLQTGWAAGQTPNGDGSSFTPDDVLSLFSTVAPNNLFNIVGNLDASQIGFLDSSSNFDVGPLLGSLDENTLSGFMRGWDSNVLQYLTGLPGFDLSSTLGGFDPTALMGLMSDWQGQGAGNLEFLTGLNGFSFGSLMGADPNQMMTLMSGLGTDFQNAIYGDFDTADFAWLDGAANFDLAGMMQSDFGFFRNIMSPEEALGLFGQVGGNMNTVVQGLDATDLAFLDGAQGFDLGAFLGTLDSSMLAGFMEGWDSDNLAFLGGLQGFDLAGTMDGFSPELMSSMMAGWGDDPNAMSFLSGLDGFDLQGTLGEMSAGGFEVPDGWGTGSGGMPGPGGMPYPGGTTGDVPVVGTYTPPADFVPPPPGV